MAREEITTPLDLSNLERHNKNYEELYGQIDATDERLSENMWEEIKEANTIKMMEPVQTADQLPAKANDKSLITAIDEQRVYAYVHDGWQPFNEIDLDPFSPFKEELASIISEYEQKIQTITSEVTETKDSAIEAIESTQSQTESNVKQTEQTAVESINKVHEEAESQISTIEQDLKDKTTEFTTKFNDYTAQLAENKNLSLDDIERAKQEALDSLNNQDTDNWQKHKLTEENGERIYFSKGDIPNLLDLESGFYETVTTDDPESQNFPSEFKSAFVQIDITKSGAQRKQVKVARSFDARVMYRYIHTDGGKDSGWLELVAKKLLFDGDVSGEGATFDLYDDPSNFSYLIIYGSNGDGEFACTSNIFSNGRFLVKDFGVYASASGAKLYKMIADKKGSNNEYEVTSSVYFGVENGKGDHSQTAKIDKVIGVK